MAGALLQTKLVTPPGRQNLVNRPRLRDCLQQGLESGHRLTLVSAPAGFGKTTLVAEWLHQVDRPAAWLSLDERENDPARFLAYLVAALQQLDPDIGEAAVTLGRSPQPPEPEALLTILINEIAALPESIILSIDDYQVIHNPAIHAQLTFLLENQPRQLHLIIMTREDPPLPVARWRARGQVNELRQSDLRFTNEETAHFLQEIMALDLAPEDIIALERRTEGWIAGLQLAALSMRGQADLEGFVRSFTGSSRYILDYLIEEVFDQQPDDVQDFMLQTSILERLCAPLCEAVTQNRCGQVKPGELERANLFLMPVDQSRVWYRYHRLFAEFLRHRLRLASAPPEAVLHQRAGRWLEANGYIEEALKHMLAAGDWVEAERLIGLAAVVAIRHGQLLTLHGWLEAFPDDIVSGSYDLAALKGFGLFLAGQLQAAGSYADMALELMPSDASSFSLGFLAALRSYLALTQGDAVNALALAGQALDYLEEDDPYFLRGAVLSSLAQALTQAGDLQGACESYERIIQISHQANQPLFGIGPASNLALILNLQGKRNEAADLCRETIAQCVSGRGRPLPISGGAHTILGLLYLEANELDAARSHLLTALANGEQMGLASGIPYSSRMVMARLQLAAGEQRAAKVTIDEARQIAAQFKSQYVAFMVAGVEAEVRLRIGDIVGVEKIMEQLELSPVGRPAHASEAHYFTFVRLLLAQRRLDEATTLLANLEQFCLAGVRQRPLISVHILRALLAIARDHEESALTSLETALSLAAPEGYRRAFLDEDPAICSLLPRLLHVAPAFVSQLLQDARADPGLQMDAGPRQPLLDPLSDRELEVLGLIAGGLSNQEIASRLFITVGTVKTHAHNIYGKLGASGRTQAVALAREMNLL